MKYYRNYKIEENQEIIGKIRCLKKTDEEYPFQLQMIESAPKGLYVLGELPDPGRRSVAIVGARSCSPYGKAEAIRFAKVLAAHGVQIISGMAYGIDAWAHQGALAGGGRTFAVLGCGVDVCYPKANYPLYRQIMSGGGGILSEFLPGTEPFAWHFPLRNRIISALSDLVLVVEAKEKSGSLITADYALEQGKGVFAIPGRNQDLLSGGTNRLLLQGAGIATSPEVLLEELGLAAPSPLSAEAKKEGKAMTADTTVLPESMTQNQSIRKVLSQLNLDPKSIDQLLSATGLPLSELSSILLQLCFSGYAEEFSPGYYCRRR